MAKYTKIPKPVKIFNNRCAELGEPNKSVFVAKLAKPTFSWGIFKKIIIIKKILTKNPTNFNIRVLLKNIKLKTNLTFLKIAFYLLS
jgi:hypothetical protein